MGMLLKIFLRRFNHIWQLRRALHVPQELPNPPMYCGPLVSRRIKQVLQFALVLVDLQSKTTLRLPSGWYAMRFRKLRLLPKLLGLQAEFIRPLNISPAFVFAR